MHSVISIKPPALLSFLFLSAAPVQAFETHDEIIKAYSASEENNNLCVGVSNYGAAFMPAAMLCDLEEKGRITKENLDLTWDEWYERQGPSPLINEALEDISKNFPECSIKPWL